MVDRVGVPSLWVAAGVLNGLDHAGVWSPAPAGLLERLSILTGFAYLTYLAHRIYRASTAVSRDRPEHGSRHGGGYVGDGVRNSSPRPSL